MRIGRPICMVLGFSMLIWLTGCPLCPCNPQVGERQLTYTAINHALDNNDNFSLDDEFLCYDTRETVGGGLNNCTSIEKTEIATGTETVLYAPDPVIVDPTNAAPGLGAASFSPIADSTVFIHGPLVSETPTIGFYAMTNRRAGSVPGDGSGTLSFLDYRDVTSATTPPGAQRGGTHRHEYSLDGQRIGLTYNDLPLAGVYDRTVAMLVPHPDAPGGVSHWFVILVPVVPIGTSIAGELERAADDSWVGEHGLMRAFIGKVRQEDGSFMNSLFIVDVPADIDVRTADAGTLTRFPSPPRGTSVYRMTHTAAGGIVRGSEDGSRVLYRAQDGNGVWQLFVIPSDGSDWHPDAAKRPVQATSLANGAGGGLRWHPSGNSVVCISNNAVVVTCVKPGPLFGVSYFLTPAGAAVGPDAIVWSRDGKTIAYNKRVPTYVGGAVVKDFNGNDFRQIFLVDFPDCNNNGIADPIEEEDAA